MKKILMRGTIAVALLGFLSSCNSDNFESDFEDGPAKRTEKRINELKESLTSSKEGWKMIYFTDDAELGGFSFLFRFEDNKVTTVSDVDSYSVYDWSRNPLVERTTNYSVNAKSSAVNLLFDEATYIHLLSDNSNYPNNDLKGKGYKGDFQFLYYGTDAEGINFLTPREGIELKMVKATSEDWTNLGVNRALMNSVNTKRTLVFVEGGETTIFNFRYNLKTRYASVLNADKTESVNGNGGIGIGFNIDEIIVSPAIEFEDGSTISVLKLENGVFKGETGSNSVIIM